ncbi:MAG: hypothetical protein WBX01_17005 [Nitrososphaeraceae archaeon]
MNHACKSVIRIDQQIKFVCIVDENAKLLVGQDLIEIHFKDRNVYLFYSDYLL